MIEKVETLFRRLRRKVSRNEVSARLFRLPSKEGTATEPGLLMVQIDGLSRSQFEKALARRQMPFLRKLLRREHYRLSTHYSSF